MPNAAPNQPIRRRLEPLISAPPALLTKFNAVVDAVNQLNARPARPSQVADGLLVDGYWVRLKGSSGGAYGYVEIRQSGPGQWEDVPNGITSDPSTDPAYELNQADGIPDDTRVWLTLVYDNAGIQRLVFDAGSPARVFPARISGSSGPGHRFVELVQTGPSSWSDRPSGRFGTAYEINGRQGVATGERVWIAETRDSGGGVLYSFDVGTGLSGSPSGVGSASTDDAALGDAWNRDSPGTGQGLTLTLMTRWTYNAAGDATIYGFFRDLHFDSNGQLQSITAETRVAIETPVNCEGT